MLSVRKPTEDTIRRFLDLQRDLAFTYSFVGATAKDPPLKYVVDRTRVQIGEGEACFRAGIAFLKRWEQFRLPWLEAYPPDTPIRTGEVVVIVAHAANLWWLNACRIVYTIDEEGSTSKFGFAYGTLPKHAGTGEERFLIEWNQENNAVWYDVLAFSRSNHLLAKVGYPFVRLTRKRFGREPSAAIQRAVRAIL